jgi:hypothetical protein
VALTAETKEMRHLNRVLRHSFSQYRRKWTPQTLAHLVLKYFPDNQLEKQFLLSQLPQESIAVRFYYFVDLFSDELCSSFHFLCFQLIVWTIF